MEETPLAMASVPVQKWGRRYDDAKALEQGTIFPDLDKPFFAAETLYFPGKSQEQTERDRLLPLRYNYDKPEKPRRIKGFEVFSLIFSSFSKPKNHTEISRIAGGVSLTTNE